MFPAYLNINNVFRIEFAHKMNIKYNKEERMFIMTKKYDPAYKLELCKTVDSGTATVPEMYKIIANEGG